MEMEQPQLKWVSEHKNQKEEEVEVDEEDEAVTLQARRSRNGHAHNGHSFDGSGDGTNSTVTSPGSGSSRSKNGPQSGFQSTDEDEGLGAAHNHTEEHADAESNNSNSVYFDKDQGTDSANGFSDIKSNGVESFPIETNFGLVELDITSKDFDIQKNPVTEIEHQVVLPVGKENEGEVNVDNINSNAVADEIVDMIEEECDLDVPDLDVEGVIAKQETHDLFCPNCNSCITKRVILRRRKLIKRRKGRIHKPAKEVRPQLDANPEHVEVEVEENQGEHSVDGGSNDGPTPVVKGNEQDRENDVFRCLSCFSFFIPEGNGLFRIFRGKNDTETVQNSQDIPAPAANTKSFFSLFGSNKGKTAAVEQEAVTSDDTPSGLVIEQSAAPFANNNRDVSGQPTEAIKDHQDGLNGVICSNGESLMNGKSEMKIEQVTDMGMKYEILPEQNGHVSCNQPIYRIEIQNEGTNGPQKVGIDISNFSVQEYKQPEGGIASVPEKILDLVQPNKTGSTPTISVTVRESEPAALVRAEDIVGSREDTSLQTDTRIDVGIPIVAEPSEPREWDILKSIVYGGLIESITSLGVVSSAAGAGATTLNIMVLAVANLFGGLFVIGHNLGELKNDHSGEPQGRHYQLLGRREKFTLHAVVVILSFIVFGALPPIVYGFSFRVSDDRDYKLAVVAASSLLCIALLAIGKGHVQRPHRSYFRTVFYYVSVGFMASGACYLAGVLLDKLMNDLSLFESSLVSNVALRESGSEQQLGWSSI